MTLTRYLHPDYLPIPLIALMTLTRFHHFGDALHLPDASLAVFFFAGLYRNNLLLAFLLGLAGLIDYLAIANGTSAWCLSPAYVFLIPTYVVMWWAGRHCLKLSSQSQTATPFLVSALGWLILATSAAFAISNGSFYSLSGRYSDLSILEYSTRVMNYYLPYLSSTLVYSLAGYGLVKLAKALAAHQEHHKTV